MTEISKKHVEKGLTQSEASTLLEKYGPNTLPEPPKPSLFLQFIDQFKNFLVLVLIFAAIISAFFGELIDTLAIIGITILNAILGVAQERRAEKALEAVKKLSSTHSKVLREGEVKVIESELVVPSDILILEAGDKITCDGVIVEERSLFVDESILTGESISVKKSVYRENEDSPETSSVYMGTSVTKGRARVFVTATGVKTKLGEIALKIRETKKQKTPLEIQLNTLGKILGLLFLLVCAIVFTLGAIRGVRILEMLLISISLAVAAIPEGLPAVVTIVLAIGVAEMAKRNAVVRNLPAVETLGAVTHICTDKTGTLTQNKMSLVFIYFNRKLYDDFRTSRKEIHEDFIKSMVLCNDATLTSGDPTEVALIEWLPEKEITSIRKKYPRINEIPFTSESKRMSTVHSDNGHFFSVSKGATEIILDLCEKIFENGKEQLITKEKKEEILKITEDLANKGLRMLALAYKQLDKEPISEEEIESNLTFLGLVCLKDPLRPEVRDAVDKCRFAGIRPVMITGDHQITAYAIARELDFPEGKVITSAELERMDNDTLARIIEDVSIFARINPLDKLRIVEALQKKQEVVAMTGDGVNDAPALKKSDIGVAMGQTGTEVAKEASDMVLLDDNFATLVEAVFQGRTIYENMRKFIVYLLSCNIGEVLVMFLALLFGYPAPLLPLQLLWLNLVTDSFPALAIGMEKGEEGLMSKLPRGKKEPLLTKYHYGIIITQSIAITIATLTGFFIAYKRTNINEARTIAYMILVLSELLRAFSARSFEGYLFKMGFFSNRFLTLSAIGGALLLFASVYIGPFAMLFKNVVPTKSEFLYIILLAFVPFVVSEVSKVIRPE